MKKLLTLILLVFMFCLCSCSNGAEKQTTSVTEPSSATATTTTEETTTVANKTESTETAEAEEKTIESPSFDYSIFKIKTYGDYTILLDEPYFILKKNGVELDRLETEHYAEIANDFAYAKDYVFSKIGIEPVIIAYGEGIEVSEYDTHNNIKVYTISNDKFKQIEFFEDGVNLGDVGYDILSGIAVGENSFKVVYSDYPYKDYYGECVFTYDNENFRFDGVSRKFNPEEGALAIALNMHEKLISYHIKEYYEHFDFGDYTFNYDDSYAKIIEEGYRTRDEYTASLNKILTEEYAETIYNQFLVEFVRTYYGYTNTWSRDPILEEREDGLYHHVCEGFGASFIYSHYIEIVSESDEKIEANVYTMYDYSDQFYVIGSNIDTITLEKNDFGEWRFFDSSLMNNL